MSCWEIEDAVIEYMNVYDENGDGVISNLDSMNNEHWLIYEAECDTDFSDYIDSCEVHACMIHVENVYRANMNSI
jgi:hypothetical protein